MHQTLKTPDFLGFIRDGVSHQPAIRDQMHTHVRNAGTSAGDIASLAGALLADLATRSTQRHADHQAEKPSTVNFNTIRGAVLNLTTIATDPAVQAKMPDDFAENVATAMALNDGLCTDGGSISFAVAAIYRARTTGSGLKAAVL